MVDFWLTDYQLFLDNIDRWIIDLDRSYCIMYGDLHFGHFDVRAESLCPHSPHMGTCLSDLKNGTSFDNFSIMVLIDATLNVSRLTPMKTLDEMASTLSMIISLVSREASQEVVLDGLVQLVSKYSKNIGEFEEKLVSAFAISSASLQHGKNSGTVTFRLVLGSDTKIIRAIISAYVQYVKITPIPKLGLIIDTEDGSISDVSAGLAEAISLGGRISIGKGNFSMRGISNKTQKGSELPAQKLESITINLPRLAFEANKDETYFRARLAMLVTPAFAAMTQRKKDVSDMTRRGLNPIMSKSTQYMQRGSSTLILNLVGLREAVYNILGISNEKKYQSIAHKVLETAVDRAKKEGKILGENIHVSMTENDGTSDFSS